MYRPIYRKWYVRYALKGDREFTGCLPACPSVGDLSERPEDDYSSDDDLRLNITWRPDSDPTRETLEGCVMQSLFREPVKLFVGTRKKTVRYMRFNVADPEKFPVVPYSSHRHRVDRPTHQTAIRHGWSESSSPSFKIMEDRTVAVRDGPAGRSDLLIGSVGFSSGVHFWDFYWDADFFGLHPVIGVGSRRVKREAKGLIPLVGFDEESYGWHLRQKCLIHAVSTTDRDKLPAYPGSRYADMVALHKNLNPITMQLDLEQGTLGFIVHGHYLGHAFTGLKKGQKFYPVASTTFNGALIKMNYMGSYQPEPESLMKLSVGEIPSSTLNRLEETYDLPASYYRAKQS